MRADSLSLSYPNSSENLCVCLVDPVSQTQAFVALPGRCRSSDLGRREGSAQHVEGLEEIV